MSNVNWHTVRKRLFEVAVAVFGLLGVLGYVTEEIATEILLVIAAVLGIGESVLARANVERAPDAKLKRQGEEQGM